MPIILAQAEPPPAAIVPPPPQPTSGPLRYYPERAWRERIEGSAVIHCTVTTAGKLVGCTVVHEQPEGDGFGEAAIKLSPLFKMRWASRNGVPVESEVNIPIKFQLPKH